jgi:triosephosphate isomerase (TIM)
MALARKIVIGNWKMNPDHLLEARRIIRKTRQVASDLSRVSVVVCPPFPFLQSSISKRSKSPVSVGVQDVYAEERGSYTGGVSALMARDMGATHAIVGHSERRQAGDTDEIVSKKANLALEAGLKTILCVGESVHDDQGIYLESLKQQIKASLADVPKKSAKNLIVAYEPVWAIGAKDPMETSVINEMNIFVKKVLADIFGQDIAISIPILYGGAVNSRNAGDIISQSGVDGLLVGRESVNPDGFSELLRAVDAIS